MQRASSMLRPQLALAAALAGAAGLGALTTLIAYVSKPEIAIAVPIALAVVVVALIDPMAGIAIGVLAAPLEHFNVRLGGFAGLSASEAVFLLSAGSALLRGLRGERMPAAPVHHAWVAFILVVATGIFFAPDAVVPAKQTVMYSIFAVLSVYVAAQPPARLRWFFVALAVAGGLESAVAIAGGKQAVLEQGGTVAANRATSSFSHPNILGFFLVLALPVAVVVALRASGWVRAALLVNAGAIIYALGLTLSRGALLGAGLTMIILMAWRHFRRTIGVLLVVLVALTFADVGPVAGSTQIKDVRQRLATVSGERQTNPRLRIYRKAPELLTAHPVLGIGHGNFYLYSARYDLYDFGGAPFDHAHNLLLTIGVETGFIGLALFLAFCWLIVRVALGPLRDRGSPDFPYVLALVAALAGLGLNSVTDYPLNVNFVMALVLMMVGALVAYARQVDIRPQ